MKLTITINCDNAAFEPSNGDEIALILRKVAVDDFEHGNLVRGEGGALYDTLGNRVGGWTFT